MCTVVGRQITRLLPSMCRPLACSYLSPLLGLGVFVLIACLHGWLAPFKQSICLATATPIVLAALYFEPDKKGLGLYLLKLFLFAFLASTTVFLPVFLFDVYQTSTDAIHYISIAQWLQAHSFAEPFDTSVFNPFKVVHLFQIANLRMGSQFFLGYLQGLFNIKWSFYIYPVAAVLPVIAGTLAVAGIVKFAIPNTKLIALFTALAMAITNNGFAFGSHHGFFPQTFGLAFTAGCLTLISILMANLSRISKSGRLFSATIPVALCLAALVHVYPDMTPFVTVSLMGYLVILLFRIENKKKIYLFICYLILQTILLVNLEFLRGVKLLLKNLSSLAERQIGWPIMLRGQVYV